MLGIENRTAKVNSFLLLIDCRFPDSELICQLDGGIRLQVSKTDRIDLLKMRSGSIYGVAEDSMYLFENLTTYILDTSLLLVAIRWYKKIAQISELKIIGSQVRTQLKGE